MMTVLLMAASYNSTKAPTAEVRSSSGRFLGLKQRLLGRDRCGSQTPQAVEGFCFPTAEIYKTINQTQFRTTKRFTSKQRSSAKRSYSSSSSSALTAASGCVGKAAAEHTEDNATAICEGDSALAHSGGVVEPNRKAVCDNWLWRSPLRNV